MNSDQGDSSSTPQNLIRIQLPQKGSKQSFRARFFAFGAIFALFLLGWGEGKSSPVPSFSSNHLLGQITASQAPLPEDPELVLIGDNALLAFTPPMSVTPRVLGSIMGEPEADRGPEIINYAVQEGDTPSSIAEKFNVSLHTILWANELSSNSKLKPGKEIIVLPVSGVLHMVRQGDTLSEIAGWYKVPANTISEFNELSSQSVFVGDLLIIPGGKKPQNVPAGRLVQVANSYFIWPVPAPHALTQGLHPYNAVDMGGACGVPVYAAAGGTVQRKGYSGLGGNYVRILHPNGAVTYYGHLSKIVISAEVKVSQGQTIGYVGNTGHTVGATGCHLHFEVRGAGNPFAR